MAAARAAEEALAKHWPAPSLEQVRAAASAFCAMDWPFVEEMARKEMHEWTWEHQMPHRCFEAVAITTLLRDGFGFDAFGSRSGSSSSSSSSGGSSSSGEYKQAGRESTTTTMTTTTSGGGAVSFAVEVRGMELEWTLGYALASVADGNGNEDP